MISRYLRIADYFRSYPEDQAMAAIAEFAGLRLAYLVAPSEILPRLLAARAALDRFPPSFTQDAVADLMAEGYWLNHTRRMRRHYRLARDRVVAILRDCAGSALRVDVPAQGLHLLAQLPEGFVLGFSGHPLADLEQAAQRLGQAARDHLG